MSTISFRLTATIAALFVCALALASVAWITQGRFATALEALNRDAVERIAQFKVISDRYAVDIVDAAHKARNGSISFAQANATMQSAAKEIDQLWHRISALESSGANAALFAAGKAKLEAASAATRSMIAILDKGDKAALEKFINMEIYPAIDPATEVIDQLIKLHEQRGRQIMLEVGNSGTSARMALLLISVLAVSLCAFAIAYIVFGVVRPLRRSITTMEALAASTVGSSVQGLTRLQQLEAVEIAGSLRKDELGDMARTLETFRFAGIERQRLRMEADNDQQAQQQRTQAIETMIQEFEVAAFSVISSVAAASTELEASATLMTETARLTSEQSTMVSNSAQETSEAVHSLAASGNQLAVSIDEIGRQAQQSSGIAASAAIKAQASDDTVAKLSRAGGAIEEVVVLIRSIASQTNLLALNATIEAARAGEAGKGFAVVASEVKELASQTTHATNVIAEHVNAIQTASSQSTEAMAEITQMIKDINQVAASIAVAVTEQSAATKGISENVQQVAQGTAHTSESIGIVSEAAANTGAAASQVLSASEELAMQSNMMRERVDEFLRAVRAA